MQTRFPAPLRFCGLALGLLLSGLLIVSLLTPARAGKAQRSSILIPFTPMRGHGGPLVQVRLNDRETATFLVDTGASECLISDTLVQKLGLGTLPVRDRFGDEFRNGENRLLRAVVVKKLQMGGGVFKDGAFLVTDHRDLFKLSEQGLDGLIGATLLEQFALLVDGPQHRLALISPGGLSDDEIKFMGFGGDPVLKLKSEDSFLFQDAYSRAATFLVSLDLRRGDKKIRQDLVADTGASETSLSFGMAKDLGLTAYDKSGSVTFYGSYLSDVSRLDSLGLGTLPLSDFAVSYPGTDLALVPPLLGEDVFANCVSVFDFPSDKLYLKPVLPPFAAEPATWDAARTDADRLRGAAHVPFPGLDEDGDVPARLAALQKSLKDDSSDADAYRKLGEIEDADRQPEAARAAFARAGDLYRAQAAPARQAEALCRAGREAEAEAAARQATTSAPTDPAAWIALGRVLHARSLQELTGQGETVDISDDFVDYQALIARLRKAPPAPDAVAQAAALSEQAQAAFDKAVAAAPADAAAYQARADFRADRGLGLVAIQRELRGDRFPLFREMYTDGYFADVEQAAAIQADDPVALRDAAEADAQIPLARSEPGLDTRESRFFSSLPRKYRQAAQAKIDRLGALAKSDDKAKAAGALEALGETQRVVLRDDVLAETTLRRCLALDPDRPRALHVLARLLTDARRYDDLAALLTDQIAKHDTPLNRLLLARTLERQGRLEEAVAQAEAAWKMRPDDYATNVSLAALRLRRSGDDAEALAGAGRCLSAAAKAMGHHPGRARAAEYAVLNGIFLGLSGDPQAAEKQALQVLRDNRTDTDARDVLAAVIL